MTPYKTRETLQNLLLKLSAALSFITFSFPNIVHAKFIKKDFFNHVSFNPNADYAKRSQKIKDNFIRTFSSSFDSYGANLIVNFKIENNRINAEATRRWNDWQINIYGGLLSHHLMTNDALVLIMCHELAHHIGGAPKKELLYASSEAQADYWATAVCLKKYFRETMSKVELSERAVQSKPHLTEEVQTDCATAYPTNVEQNICVLSVQASIEVTNFLNALRKKPAKISLSTPDQKTVMRTNIDYPRLQCRLDTFFQGALCGLYPDSNPHPFDQRDELLAGCMEQNDHLIGRRPSCWYKPFSVIPH